MIQDIVKASCYPTWMSNTQSNSTFLSLSQAKPLFRLLIGFASNVPHLETSEWVELIASVTAILVNEKHVIKSLSSFQRRTLLFTVAKLGSDIAIKSQYEPNTQSKRSSFDNCRQMMLCSFLCLWELKRIALSPSEFKLVKLYLTYLNTVRTPVCGVVLLHVLVDFQNVYDMKVEGETYCDRMGQRSVVMNTPKGKPFVFVPCAEYLKWAIEDGEAEPNCLTNSGYSPLDWFFEWINPLEDNWHLIYYKQRVMSMINYLMKCNVESVVDPNYIVHMLNQSFVI